MYVAGKSARVSITPINGCHLIPDNLRKLTPSPPPPHSNFTHKLEYFIIGCRYVTAFIGQVNSYHIFDYVLIELFKEE